MKVKYRYALACLLTGAVCLGAVLLPARLVTWWDRQCWLGSSQSVDVSQSNVSYSYALTTAERLSLLIEYMQLATDGSESEASVRVLSDLTPAENEISAEQALSICLEELGELVQQGLLPSVDTKTLMAAEVSPNAYPFYAVPNSTEYLRLVDWDDPQRKLSLWTITLYPPVSISSAGQQKKADSCSLDNFTCLMDAETGKLLLFSCGGPINSMEQEQMLREEWYAALDPEAWADYLGLTEPEAVPYTPPELTDDNRFQMKRLIFSQEDPSFSYYIFFSAVYAQNVGDQSGTGWFQLAYSPIWPA